MLKEDTKGLYFEARISDTALGRDVKTLIRDGVLTEFSIGYDPIEFEFDATGIRHLRKVKLWEISIVTWAMNPEATVTDYKQQKQTTEEVHMRLENNATGPSAGKSMSMGTDELKEIVKSAVKEAKEGAASDDDSPSDSDELKELMDNFAAEHNYRWQVGMNGRSGGYLVLYQGEITPSGYKSFCTSCGQLN